MEKLFIALSEKYGGAEVRDVKFIVNPSEVDDQDSADLDAKLAEVVKKARPIESAAALV